MTGGTRGVWRRVSGWLLKAAPAPGPSTMAEVEPWVCSFCHVETDECERTDVPWGQGSVCATCAAVISEQRFPWGATPW